MLKHFCSNKSCIYSSKVHPEYSILHIVRYPVCRAKSKVLFEKKNAQRSGIVVS